MTSDMHDGHDDMLGRLVAAADEPARRVVIFEAMFRELMGLLNQPDELDTREDLTRMALAAYLGMNVSAVAVDVDRLCRRMDRLEEVLSKVVTSTEANALTASVMERFAPLDGS